MNGRMARRASIGAATTFAILSLQRDRPDLRGKPANLVRYPRTRDKAWLSLFDKHKGRIDEAFAFEAFTTPPLAAFPSCDVKFTTTELARSCKAGPCSVSAGKTWDPSPSEKKKYPTSATRLQRLGAPRRLPRRMNRPLPRSSIWWLFLKRKKKSK